MTRLATCLSLVVLAVVPAACGDGSDAEVGDSGDAGADERSSTAVDGFSVRVTTDRASYFEGDLVQFTVEICNRGTATTTEGGGGSDIPFSWQILDEQDAVVADDSHAMRTTELRIVEWVENQCRAAQGSWDQHYWNRPEDRPSEPPEVYGAPQRGETVPRGRYRVRVDAGQGTATSDPFELRQLD